jgi:site-specific DNA-methyltransferase (adenine-specific)
MKKGIKLYCGDCLEVMKKIPDKSIDMILCDLPYGTTACKWDVVIPFEPLWKEYKRIIKDNGAIVLTASQPFTSALVMSNVKMFKYEWIWKKSTSSNFLQSNYQPRKIHEDVLIFSKGKASFTKNGGKMNYFPQMWGEAKKTNTNTTASKGLKSWNGRMRDDYNIVSKNDTGKRFPESIIEFKTDKTKLHPTQKPVALLEYLIKTYTIEGETVLDNCMGSGSTGVACVNTNRKFIGIEKDKTYFNIAEKRIEEAGR